MFSPITARHRGTSLGPLVCRVQVCGILTLAYRTPFTFLKRVSELHSYPALLPMRPSQALSSTSDRASTKTNVTTQLKQSEQPYNPDWMKMRLAGLRFLIGDNLHIHIRPGVGLSITHFFFVLLA
jgi:hypothetical protein